MSKFVYFPTFLTLKSFSMASRFLVSEQSYDLFLKTIIPKENRLTVGGFCKNAVEYFQDSNNIPNEKKFLDYVNQSPSGLDKQKRLKDFTLKSVHSYICYFFWDIPHTAKQYQGHTIENLKSFFSYLTPKPNEYNIDDYKITNEFISWIIGSSKFNDYYLKVDQNWNLIVEIKNKTKADHQSINHLEDDVKLTDEKEIYIDAEKVYLKAKNLEGSKTKYKPKKVRIKKLDISIFDFVAVLNEFKLRMPVSLIKKLNPKRWNLLKTIIKNKNNDTGIIQCGNSLKGEFYLTLDRKGKLEAENIEIKHELIFKILENCDTNLRGEEFIFERFTLKRKYFVSLFKDFSYDIGDLIHSEKYPSHQKKILLFRLLGFYYFELKEYKLMRESFKKCVSLLKEENIRKSSAFYLDWAGCEKAIGNNEKEIEIYNEILNDFTLPEHKNRSTRFYLSILYYKINEIEKATSLFSVDDYSLLKTPKFWDKISNTISELIKNDYSKDATILQYIIKQLTIRLKKENKHDLSIFVLEQINLKIYNNNVLKTELIKSYFKTDKSQAIALLKKLEKSNFNKINLASLYIDYYLSTNSIDSAIEHAKSFLQLNSNLNVTLIYLKLGNIYSKELSDWKKAKFYFEKSNAKNINSSYLYAITLFNLNNKEDGLKAIKIFQNYFTSNAKSVNKKVISGFVNACLKYDRKILAGKLISQKLKAIKSEEYPDSFISFLYQQQLKLTVNHELSEILLNSALEYAEDFLQKAIVFSNYAKHLMYKPESSVFDIEEAIEYFKKSNELKYDSRVVLDIARGYFNKEDFDLCLKTLNDINDTSLESQISLLKIQSLAKLDNFQSIKEILPLLTDGKTKSFAYYYLAENKAYVQEERVDYYKESIKYSKGYFSKLRYAVYLYSIGQPIESRKVQSEIKGSIKNRDEKIKIENIYKKEISTYTNPIKNRIIDEIERKISHLKKRDYRLINGINNLIKKHPLNEQPYKLKYNYFFKLNEFSQSEKILNILIENDQINFRTSELFYKLAFNNYKYSNFFSHNNKINQESQKTALLKALYFMEYALKVKKTLKYIKLYSIIPYKQGSFKKHKKIIQTYSKLLSDHDQIELDKFIEREKEKIKIFLWPDSATDYFNKRYFYRRQENFASVIIGNDDQKDKTIALKILKSISSDTSFHEENNFYLLKDINTRLAHYHYEIDKSKGHYKKAFHYQKKVSKVKSYDESFIGAHLVTVAKLNEINYGIKICEFYLKKNKTSLIYRFYGNFLKEKGLYNASYDAYIHSLNISNGNKEKTFIHNNILMLCHTSMVVTYKPFKEVFELKEISKKAFQNIKQLNPFFKYLDDAIKYLKEINEFEEE